MFHGPVGHLVVHLRTLHLLSVYHHLGLHSLMPVNFMGHKSPVHNSLGHYCISLVYSQKSSIKKRGSDYNQKKKKKTISFHKGIKQSCHLAYCWLPVCVELPDPAVIAEGTRQCNWAQFSLSFVFLYQHVHIWVKMKIGI